MPSIEDRVGGLRKIDGYFPLYWDERAGTLLLEIPRLDTEFLFSTGLSIVLYGAIPKWLGWVAIALAVIGLTPLGFAAFLGTGVWILIVSIMLTMRARSETATA